MIWTLFCLKIKEIDLIINLASIFAKQGPPYLAKQTNTYGHTKTSERRVPSLTILFFSHFVQCYLFFAWVFFIPTSPTPSRSLTSLGLSSVIFNLSFLDENSCQPSSDSAAIVVPLLPPPSDFTFFVVCHGRR